MTEEMSYKDAVNYCEASNSSLASIRDRGVVDNVTTVLNQANCSTVNNFNIGLVFNGTRHGWEDGTEYNVAEHHDIFNYNNVTDGGCIIPNLYLSEKIMEKQQCEWKSGFFCLVPEDVNIAPAGTSLSLVIGIVFVLLLLVFVAGCWYKKRAKTEKPDGNDVEMQ